MLWFFVMLLTEYWWIFAGFLVLFIVGCIEGDIG
jgi:hypothetical protein